MYILTIIALAVSAVVTFIFVYGIAYKTGYSQAQSDIYNAEYKRSSKKYDY